MTKKKNAEKIEKHQGEEKIHTISDTTNKINDDDEKSRMRECRWFDDFTVHMKAVSRLCMLPFCCHKFECFLTLVQTVPASVLCCSMLFYAAILQHHQWVIINLLLLLFVPDVNKKKIKSTNTSIRCFKDGTVGSESGIHHITPITP